MKSKKVFIFIPGYYGSTLIHKESNRLIWGDAKELFFKRSTLAMPIEGLNIKGAKILHPHEVIPDMQILGGLLKEEAYDKTIKFLSQMKPQAILKVAWDWRADPIDGIKRLDHACKQAKKDYPDAELILISHSFGSLIASYYLRYGIQDYFEAKETWEGLKHFNKIILSATPFRGVMTIFRNMHNGIRFGLNHKMQDALAFCTFESSYFLLPPKGFDKIRNIRGESISLGLHNPNHWIENRWGLFHEKLNLPASDSLKKFVQKNLNRAEKFHKLIHDPVLNLPEDKKKILYLHSFGLKTVDQGVWLDQEEKRNIFLYYPKDFKKWKAPLHHSIVFEDGDQTVANYSLELPEAFLKLETEVYKEKLGHLDILQNEKSQKIIWNFLH